MKTLMKIQLLPILSFLSFPHLASAGDVPSELEKLFSGITAECNDYAVTLTRAHLIGNKRKGVELSVAENNEFFQGQKQQCFLVQSYLILEVVKESISADKWQELDGDTLLVNALNKLIDTL